MSDPDLESPDINLKDLSAFVSIATLGSFRRASAHLYTSQPALSRSVARLEKALGARLLDRDARGARVTTMGSSFLDSARKILSLIDDFRTEAREGWNVTIRLGAAATAAGSYLAPFLAEWIPSHPEIRVLVLEDGAGGLRTRLDHGECDLAIISDPVSARLEALPLTRVAIRAYIPADHPLADRQHPLTLAELAPYRLLINDDPYLSARVTLDAFAGAGIRPHIVYRSSSGHTLGALSEAGMGVAVFGDSVDLRGSSLVSRAIMSNTGMPLHFDLHIAWPKETTPDFIRQFGTALSRFSTGRSVPDAALTSYP